MKNMKGLALGLALAAALVFGLAPAATAQTLDGKWFKVNCQCFTKAVNPITGEWTEYNFSFNAYYYFGYSGPGPAPQGSVYNYQIWCQTSPGHWAITGGSSQNTVGVSEHFFSDWGLDLYAQTGAWIHTYHSPYVSVTPNIFRGGGEVNNGQDPQGRPIYGWVLMKGQIANSLPFHPI